MRYHEQSERGYAGDVMAPLVVKYAKRYTGERVLDVGAGSGALIDLVPGSIGIDLTPRHPNVQKGDITAIPFEADSFDTVFATELFEHLSDDVLERGLREVSRVLKRKRFLIITVPYNERLALHMVTCPKCGEHFHQVGHLRSFAEDSMTRMLMASGFRVVRMKILPLGLIAQYPWTRWFVAVLRRWDIVRDRHLNLFVVAENNKQ